MPRWQPLIVHLVATVHNGEMPVWCHGGNCGADSGDGGRQWRRGGGGGALPLAVGPPLGAAMQSQWPPYGAGV